MKEMEVLTGDRIAVWFSCGAASAVAARLIIDLYKNRCQVKVVNNPVMEEHPDNQRFLKDVEQWIDQPIERAINPQFPSASAQEIWDWKRYMSGVQGAPCTKYLKKEARRVWESSNPVEWHVLGFTAEEKDRDRKFRERERANVLPVLIDAGLTKRDCFAVLERAGLTVPEAYRLGYPNANCIGCVKATSPTYWNHVRKVNPEVFADRAEQSRRIGARLVRHKGKRMFLDELPSDAIGAPMKSLPSFECSSFCEEKDV